MDYSYVNGNNRPQYRQQINVNNQNCRPPRSGQSFQSQQFGNATRNPQPYSNNSGYPSTQQIRSHNNSSHNFTNQFNFPLRSDRGFANSSSSSTSGSNNALPRKKQNQQQQHPTDCISSGDVAQNLNNSKATLHRSLINPNENAGAEPIVVSAQSAQPQYRIFKRGDTIPGISSPISLTSGTHHTTESLGAPTLSSEVSSQADVIFNGSSVNLSENNKISIDTFNQEPPSAEPMRVMGIVDIPQEETESSSNIRSSKSQLNRTPISLVSDIARFHGLAAEYRLTNETGPPHAPTFTLVLNLGTEQYQAHGSSIKKAQLAAAAKALEQTTYKSPPPRAQPKKPFQPGAKNNQRRSNWSVTQLNTLAEELGETISFASQAVPILNQYNNRAEAQSVVAIHVGDRVFSGEGVNLNAAKNNAATVALKSLIQIKKERELAKFLEQQGEGAEDPESLDTDNKSPISIVHEMALKRGMKVTFDIVGEEGPPHIKVFTIKCSVGALESNGEGPTKQQAKKASCEAMILKLKDVPLKQPKTVSLKSIQNGLKMKPKVARKKPTTPVIKIVDKQIVSPISRLLQIAHIRKYKEPEFSVVEPIEGAEAASNSIIKTHDRRNKKKKPFFTMQVTVGPHICQGSGSNKKVAKKAAADAALVVLGYAPTDSKENDCGHNNEMQEKSEEHPLKALLSAAVTENANKRVTDHKITSARQIVPGVLVLKTGTTGQAPGSPSASPAVAAQEMVKVNSLTPQPAPYKVLDGIRKLSYLADLLGIGVSYSDFPKKNEFLSVASLGTNPPHVAHGIGPTREDAQNSAALQILDELSNSGLDSVSSSSPRSSALGGME